MILHRILTNPLVMTVTEYVARNVTVIDFSDLRNIQVPVIYQLQSCVIKFETTSVDIGARCYSDFTCDVNGKISGYVKNSQGIRVVRVSLHSFDEKRTTMLQKLFEYIVYLTISSNQSTIKQKLGGILRFFSFYWTQLDLDCFNLENQAHYEEAARRFSASLIAKKKMGSQSDSRNSRAVFRFAEFVYDLDNRSIVDYNVIPNLGQGKHGTSPMLLEDQDLALALRVAVFEAVVDLVINNKTLPFPLKVPSICKELNDTVWLGYSPWRGSSPFPRAKDFEKKQPKEWFNREIGCLLTKEQWCELDSHKTSGNARNAWYMVEKTLRDNNKEGSNTKLNLIEHASLCFIDLLLSMTGMNQQAALNLPWVGGYFSQKAKQGNKTVFLVSADDQVALETAKEADVYLRSIKNRKGYQPVEVTITNRILRLFKKYLQLREIYLKKRSSVRLFPFTTNVVEDRRRYLLKQFPEIPKLGPKQARANMSNAILTEVNDPHIAAQILQNTPGTVIKHYAAGTQQSHIQAVGGFFNTIGNQIRATRTASDSSMETAVGSCDQGGTQPDPLPDAPFDLNCSHQQGCFFCKHYSVHADEIDIRKLVSVLFYINAGATRAHDVNTFNDLFGAIINRINQLLEEIGRISLLKKQLVSRVKEEVFTEEALDEYWLCKLNRLETLMGVR